MQSFIGALAALCLSGAAAALAPEPPPPPPVWDAQVALFRALPRRFPAEDISAFEKLVADDVKVYREGKLVHETRQVWIEELQDRSAQSAEGPQGYTVSRDQFHRLADGGISVREFSYPVPPAGRQIVYHPDHPLRYVTYYLNGGRLVRVDYGPPMSSYAGLCQALTEAASHAAGAGAGACD